MATTDSYGQSVAIAALTDAPNAQALAFGIVDTVVPRTVMRFASASARAATLTSPIEGMTTWLQDVNVFAVYDGTTWQPMPLGGTWAAYTPSWTGATTNPVLGNGSLAGRWTKVGSMVTFAIKLTAGSTTTFGSGPWSLTLPTTSAANIDMVGSVMVGDVSAGASAYSNGISYMATSSGVVQPYAGGKGDMGIVSSVHPQVWANGDRLWVSGVYESL